MTSHRMPALLDREVASAEHDAFGHRHFASALRSLIESEELNPPYSIGLLGGWGTGKSTINALYQASLKDDTTDKGKRRAAIHTVTFNAWRYAENVKRALLRQVYLDLGGNEQRLNEKLFGETRRTDLASRKFFDVLKDTATGLSVPITIVAFLLVAAGLVSWGVVEVLQLNSNTAKAFVTVAIYGVVTYASKALRWSTASPHHPVTKVELPTTTAEQYQDLLLRQLKVFKEGKNRACERLVVFVDDLDRLSADEMVQGLDAVRTFMEIPHEDLPSGLGIVFVISCDEARIAQALAKGRRNSDLPGSVFTRSDARRYLDRIFQFRLEIPPFPRLDMRSYARAKLESLNLPGLTASIDDIVDTMIHVGVQSPRNALQIVNAFSQAWWIAHRREHAEAGSTRPGALHEGAVTGHPLTLAALSTVRVDFPDFYSDLELHDSLIHRFTAVVFRDQPFAELPQPTREVLSKYIEKREGDPDVYGPDVLPNHRPLRQFLASLQNHRWPPSLQPLLLLSQDSVSRRFGDGAHAVYDALVSGDEHGVLEGLGRDLDAKPLQDHDVQLLEAMAEDLPSEPEPRQLAASAVLASLLERIPKGSARSLVRPLVRKLESSQELRSRLGVAKIRTLLVLARETGKREIAAALINDTLVEDNQALALTLPSGQPPNLDEALDITRDVVACVLEVRKEHGLPALADIALCGWFLARGVTDHEGNTQTIPLSELQGWVAEQETDLLSLLGSDYSDQLISDFKSGPTEDLDVPTALNHLRTILSKLHEQNRDLLWAQLERLAAVRNSDAAKLAWELLDTYSATPTSASLSKMVKSVAGRLEKDMTTTDGWEVDWEHGANAIITVVEKRSSHLSSDAVAAFSELVSSWGLVDDTTSCALRALRCLTAEQSHSVVDEWVPILLTELPIPCVDYLAENYAGLSDTHHATIGEQLQTVVAGADLTDKKGKAYQRFITRLPAEAWSLKPLKEHLAAILPQIGTKHANPKRYLFCVFPAVVRVLRHAEPAAVGSMLHTLFSNAKGHPPHYSWLHTWMAGSWPAPSDELGPYNPQTIFSEAHTFATSRAEADGGLLRSMIDMLDRAIVAANLRPQYLEAVCSVWANNREDALKQLLGSDTALTPQQTADLMDHVSWDEEEDVQLLRQAWEHISPLQSAEQRVDATLALCAKGPQGTSDQALALWIDANLDPAQVVREAVRDEQFKDPARKRLWAQALRCAEQLGSDSLVSLISFILTNASNETSSRAVLDSQGELDAVFATATSRARLAEVLLTEVFPTAPTTTIKGDVAAWLKGLNAASSVKHADASTLTAADVNILETHFGATIVKKLRKAIEKTTESSASPGEPTPPPSTS